MEKGRVLKVFALSSKKINSIRALNNMKVTKKLNINFFQGFRLVFHPFMLDFFQKFISFATNLDQNEILNDYHLPYKHCNSFEF